MHDKGAVIVLIPQFAVGDQHSTLVGAGTAGHTVGDRTRLCQAARFIASTFPAPMAYVSDHAVFNANTNVALLEGGDLYALRMLVDDLNQSQWGYRPHISEQPGAGLVPVGTVVKFDRIAVWYGAERYSWRFGSGQATAAF